MKGYFANKLELDFIHKQVLLQKKKKQTPLLMKPHSPKNEVLCNFLSLEHTILDVNHLAKYFVVNLKQTVQTMSDNVRQCPQKTSYVSGLGYC